jgi:hypothetical protein
LVCDSPSIASLITSCLVFDGPAIGASEMGSSSASSILASFCNIVARTSIAGSSGGRGTCASHEVSLLGASISAVTTFGLNGHTPVFLKAALIFSGVSARTWAFPYTVRKLFLSMAAPFSRSHLSRSLPINFLSGEKITMSSP